MFMCDAADDVVAVEVKVKLNPPNEVAVGRPPAEIIH